MVANVACVSMNPRDSACNSTQIRSYARTRALYFHPRENASVSPQNTEDIHMQLAVAGSEPYLPWKFREANSQLDDLALEIAAAHGDARLPLIERAAAIALGHAE